nr:MAG TPA: hypothetical protein [Bacteriophage sp.]
MKYYVKVTKQVAEKIIRSGVPLTMTSDGNCLLYQSELNGVDGVNLNERAANVGGSLVAESDALAEIKGTTDTSASCYTPVEFGGEGDIRNNDYIVSGGGGNLSSENNTDTKEESEVSDE